MKLFDRLLVKVITSRKGVLHFRRWQLLRTRWFALYIHCISHSDEELHMHDHPWSFVSLILRGGYLEHLRHQGNQSTIVSEYVRLPGWIAYRRAKDFHKIQLLTDSTWTLVLVGPVTNDPWGYWVDGTWVDNETYRKNKHARR